MFYYYGPSSIFLDNLTLDGLIIFYLLPHRQQQSMNEQDVTNITRPIHIINWILSADYSV